MPVTRPAKFAHVVYRTRRFDEMLRWYQTVFGATVQYANPGLAFLTYDDEHHRFAFANLALFQPNGTDAESRSAVGVDHVAYTYSSVADLIENYALLKESGIIPYWCVHHGITVSMYYADPDANQMEFQVDCLESFDDASKYMAECFAKNPVGVEYDPDEWLERLHSGETEAGFLHREADEPVSPIRGYFAELVAS